MSESGDVPLQGRDPRHRYAARLVVACLIALAALAVPFSQFPLPAAQWFMPSFGAMIVLTDGLTAGLLIVQSGLNGMDPVRRLGAAYMASALIVVPHLLAFPGVFAATPVIGGTDTAIWLWCFWHGGFAAGVLHFLLAGDRARAQATRHRDLRRLALTGLLLTLVPTLVATLGLPWLPTLLQGGNYHRLTSLGIGPAILAANLLAAALVLVRLRCRDALSAWLWAAMVAATLDVTLTMFGGGRFTVGWFGARVLSLVTGVTVLFALLSHLLREAGRVAEVNAQLERLLCTDVLTGVANRRAFDAALHAEWRRASRAKAPVSLLMVDVDRFKRFNDHYGHPAGDDCLRQVAGALRAGLHRPSDLAARLGGEEFGLLLPATDAAGAQHLAERIRGDVSRFAIRHEASELGHVTISVGVATAHPFADGGDADLLVSRADRALYRAKASGRDAVRSWTEPDTVKGGSATALVS